MNINKNSDAARHEGSAEETFGNEQVHVEIGKPFIISKARDYHWFPTLKQVSRTGLPGLPVREYIWLLIKSFPFSRCSFFQ